MIIAVINGPNINLLGTREPAIYGSATLAEIEERLVSLGEELAVRVECAQRNGEGELIDLIHSLRGRAEGIVINPGAYGHSSLAIRDALVGVSLPYVEIHVTNIYAREPARRRSVLARDARATLTGFGAYGYELALRGIVRLLKGEASGSPSP